MITSTEIGDAMHHMSSDMHGKLGNYMTSLQHRYGDPRVYAAQREEMAMEQAAVNHAQSRSKEEVLQTAYDKKRITNRETHNARMTQLRESKQRTPYHNTHPQSQHSNGH